MAVSNRLTAILKRAKVRRHEPSAIRRPLEPDLPALGVQGVFLGERPPLDVWTEAELDLYAEMCYRRSMGVFEAMVASDRKARPRRRRNVDYTTKNCEESRGERGKA